MYISIHYTYLHVYIQFYWFHSFTSIQKEKTSYHARVILSLVQEEFAFKDLIILPVEISLFVQDCVARYQHTPPTNWHGL